MTSTNYAKLRVFSDGGHAWLRVPIDDIRLAVMQGMKVSTYSYISEKYVYLEEDCDLSAFIEFRQIPREIIQGWKNSYSHRGSSVRDKARFTLPRLGLEGWTS